MVSILTSGLSFQGQQVVRGWLAYELTESPLAVGIAVASWGLPMLLFSLPGGVAADRMSRRGIMISMQAVSALGAVVIGLLVATGHIAFWHLIVSGVVAGTAIGLHMPSRQSFIFELAGPEHIANAVALNSGAMNSMRLIAPALAGVLISTIGVDWMYYLIALGFGVSILVVVLRTQEPPARPATTSSPAQDITNGFKYVWNNRLVFWLLVMALATLFLGLPFRNLMPAFAVEALKQGPAGYGMLMSAVGLGAIVGSLSIASLGSSGRKGLLLLMAAAGWGVGLIVFSLSTSLTMAIPLLLLLGLTSTGFMTLNNILIQTSVSNEFRGRVLSFFMLTFAMNSVGTVPVGAVAEFMGVGRALMWSGVAVLAVAILIGLSRRDLRRLR